MSENDEKPSKELKTTKKSAKSQNTNKKKVKDSNRKSNNDNLSLSSSSSSTSDSDKDENISMKTKKSTGSKSAKEEFHKSSIMNPAISFVSLLGNCNFRYMYIYVMKKENIGLFGDIKFRLLFIIPFFLLVLVFNFVIIAIYYLKKEDLNLITLI